MIPGVSLKVDPEENWGLVFMSRRKWNSTHGSFCEQSHRNLSPFLFSWLSPSAAMMVTSVGHLQGWLHLWFSTGLWIRSSFSSTVSWPSHWVYFHTSVGVFVLPQKEFLPKLEMDFHQFGGENSRVGPCLNCMNWLFENSYKEFWVLGNLENNLPVKIITRPLSVALPGSWGYWV
jgi:hypothetical protein